jgi:hypothetical protein
MPALSKFLVLLALFLLTSHVHAYTSLSLVAGDQVRVNHLIRLQQLMSKPTNEPKREPVRKPTKQMDLDAKLPNNLSSTKTRVAYSEPKQDAELPIKVTDSTITQTRGLCHDKKIRAGIFSGAVNCCNQQFPKYFACRHWLALSKAYLANGS